LEKEISSVRNRQHSKGILWAMRLFAAACLLACATYARAEPDWSGAYAGADGAYGWGVASTGWVSDGDGLFGSGTGQAADENGGGFQQSLSGGMWGAHVGWRHPLAGRLLWGVEAAYGWGNIWADSWNYQWSNLWPGNKTGATLRVKTLFSFAPQLGWAWGPWLLRGGGGLGGGKVLSQLYSEAYNSGIANQRGPTTFSQENTRVGWMASGGVERALGRNWSAGAAFDYYDLGKMDFGGRVQPDIWWPFGYKIHPIVKTVSARISYRFGTDAGAAAAAEKEREQAPQSWLEPERKPDDELVGGLRSGDPAVRSKAAIRLGQLGGSEAVPPLLSALSDKSSLVRGAAADALGKLGDRRAFVGLTARLQDREPKVRALAARALGVLGDERAIPLLERAEGHDADQVVRREAAAALKKLERP
jgi:opacity protein-like surface antigen